MCLPHAHYAPPVGILSVLWHPLPSFPSGGRFLSFLDSFGRSCSCGYLGLLLGMFLIYGYVHHVDIVIIFYKGGGFSLLFCMYLFLDLLEVIVIVPTFHGCVAFL